MLKTPLTPPPRSIRSMIVVASCVAMLALSGCSSSHKASLTMARDGLAYIQESLARAQNALAAGTTAEQREAARVAVAAARRDLMEVRQSLAKQPEGAARTAGVTALTAVDTALAKVTEALGTTDAALATGAGPVVLADMHTTLAQAQTALNDAQKELAAALAADPAPALRVLLTQVQATLSRGPGLAHPAATERARGRAERARGRLGAGTPTPEPEPEPPPPTTEERDLSRALTDLTGAQTATAAARTALAAAQAALEKVETDFQATAAAWTGDTTDEQKTADRDAARDARAMAQAALATAETALVTARGAERTAAAALATAAAAARTAATTDEQRMAATTAAGTATSAQTATLAWAATRIAGDAGLARPPAILNDIPEAPAVSVDDRPPFTVRVSLMPREAATGCTALMECPNPAAMGFIKTAATPYAAGKTVLSPEATGDDDWFALRTISMRGDVRHSYEGTTGDSASNRPKVPVVQRATTIDGTAVTGSGITAYQRHYQNPMTSSIRFTPDGMVFRTGGQGTVMSLFKHDVDRSSSRGRDGINQAGAWNVGGSDDCSGAYPAWCFDFNRSDAEASFGAPYADPDGEPNYYWASRYGLAGNQPQPDPADSDGRRLAAHGAMGDLRAWVSNYGGLDAGAMADSATDDADRYLSYAAYGLFVFTDYIDEYPRPGFLQGYHFGYDAFRDEATARTSDVSTSIAATFEGRTMGMILHPRSNSVGSETAPHVGHFTRLRGDVTLNACIGGSACTGDGIPTGANRISGAIDNLQALENGVWQKYAFLRHAAAAHATHANIAVRLVEDDIEADGSYSGAADSWQAGQWNQGEYSGALYGPTDKLETAGWWRLETDSAYQNRHLVAFGSFGACQAEHCRVTD